MRYLAAYLLLVQGGNAAPTAKDIAGVLESVGVDAEESRITALLSELEGKSVEELIAEGNTKLASVPSGGAAASSSAAAAGGAVEEAKEEKEEEAKEESDDDMGFGLFD